MAAGNNYKTCLYSAGAGEKVVYVLPGCPNGDICAGTLVCGKDECRKCKDWKERGLHDRDGTSEHT